MKQFSKTEYFRSQVMSSEHFYIDTATFLNKQNMEM